ncbi:hypothetical protein E3N88_40867 [Mikania micrantha]|uniref:Plastid lipid-associated protein/fibrillin conserved domain-containing protein n=1 Tax=Mikania micrantha TaxID=192012 RepID=A0A5N6LNS3_9ASTR|nr:hypothetical protein E3N88_40867 [Mikania micrantha]
MNDDTASAPPAWARSDSIHPCRWIDLLLSAFLDPFRQPISLTRTVVSPATLPQTYPFFTIHPVQFTISFHLRHPSRALHPATNHREKNARPRRFGASFFQFFSTKNEDTQSLKLELLEYIASLDRGANASSEQQDRVDQIARKLEAANKVKEPLESNLLNGKWELLTQHLNQSCRQRFTQNLGLHLVASIHKEPSATANLVPLNAKQVAVKFDAFKVLGLIPIRARGSGRGQLEITYLDEELRISRGNEGNLFILRMVDPTYRVTV